MTPDSDSLISENRHIGQIALIRSVFYAFIFGIGFFLSFNQAMKPRIYHSDLFLHLNSAKRFTLDKLLSHAGIGIVFLKHMGLRTPNIFIPFLLVSGVFYLGRNLAGKGYR